VREVSSVREAIFETEEPQPDDGGGEEGNGGGEEGNGGGEEPAEPA
jgi:hypothetical protein